MCINPCTLPDGPPTSTLNSEMIGKNLISRYLQQSKETVPVKDMLIVGSSDECFHSSTINQFEYMVK